MKEEWGFEEEMKDAPWNSKAFQKKSRRQQNLEIYQVSSNGMSNFCSFCSHCRCSPQLSSPSMTKFIITDVRYLQKIEIGRNAGTLYAEQVEDLLKRLDNVENDWNVLVGAPRR